MRTVHCPLCGLRFAHTSELDAHARDEHAPATVLPHYEPRHAHDVYPEDRDPADHHDEVLRLPW